MSLKAGTYLDTSEKDYRAWPGINYSAMSRFNESQDHALLGWPAKSYFEEGTGFELLIEDRAKGTQKFAERFFLSDAPGAMPDDLAGWIESGEDLDGKYVYTKKNELHGGKKRLHAWLDSCQPNPGKMPMGKDQMEMLGKMVENFMVMQPFYNPEDKTPNVTPMSDILPRCDFQVPILWYAGKMRKKALLDCMIETAERVYVFDIKTAADLSRYHYALKEYGWIQECHYTAGVQSIFKDKEVVWRFLVSSKAEPWLAQPFQVDPHTMQEYAMDAYYDLCERYQDWKDDGSPPKGWLELEAVKVFFN